MDSPNVPENLEDLDSQSLLMARSVFMILQEMCKNAELPVSFPDPETFLQETQDEIDRLDLELLSRGEVL